MRFIKSADSHCPICDPFRAWAAKKSARLRVWPCDQHDPAQAWKSWKATMGEKP